MRSVLHVFSGCWRPRCCATGEITRPEGDGSAIENQSAGETTLSGWNQKDSEARLEGLTPASVRVQGQWDQGDFVIGRESATACLASRGRGHRLMMSMRRGDGYTAKGEWWFGTKSEPAGAPITTLALLISKATAPSPPPHWHYEPLLRGASKYLSLNTPDQFASTARECSCSRRSSSCIPAFASTAHWFGSSPCAALSADAPTLSMPCVCCTRAFVLRAPC
jgi:hypothetical protein